MKRGLVLSSLVFLILFMSVFTSSQNETASNSNTTTSSITCTDTDGGINIFLYGKTYNNLGTYPDFCLVAGGTFKYVDEYYCENNSIKDKVMECPTTCSDGACIASSTTNATSGCTDSDGGMNIYVKGYAKGFKDYNPYNQSMLIYDHCFERSSSGGGGREVNSCSGSNCAQEEAVCNENGPATYSPGGNGNSCPEGCSDGACISVGKTTNTTTTSQQVKCVFKDSKTLQKCYTSNNAFYCSGEGSCTVDISGIVGTLLQWKSSCGGSAEFMVGLASDGGNIELNFNCGPNSGVNETEIRNNGFKFAYWECYNGENQKGDADSFKFNSTCQSSDIWKNLASSFCEGKCSEEGTKCGVNSFGVTDECYLEGSVKVSSTKEFGEDVLICKDSCPLDGKCYPFGYRKSGEYCSDTGQFIAQLEADKTCDNNFECSSNVCANGNCISSNFLQKILDFFKRLFGGE